MAKRSILTLMDAKDRRIAELEKRLAELEALLKTALEKTPPTLPSHLLRHRQTAEKTLASRTRRETFHRDRISTAVVLVS